MYVIVRQKQFGLIDKITSFFKKFKTTGENTEAKDETINNLSNREKIKVDKILFSDLVEKDYYPALVTLGIKDVDDGTPDHSWGLFENWLKKSGMISGGNLIAVHVISDNVKGDKGGAANVLEFSPGTKINSSIRLQYINTFKWPEDFIYNYSSWYKSSN